MVRDVRTKQPVQSDDHLVSHTVHGVIRETVPGTSSRTTAPTASSGMVFRGLWSNAVSDYVSQNVVFRTPSGGSAGVYIALLDSVPSGTAPETGAPYWAAFPYPPPGVWG